MGQVGEGEPKRHGPLCHTGRSHCQRGSQPLGTWPHFLPPLLGPPGFLPAPSSKLRQVPQDSQVGGFWVSPGYAQGTDSTSTGLGLTPALATGPVGAGAAAALLVAGAGLTLAAPEGFGKPGQSSLKAPGQ